MVDTHVKSALDDDHDSNFHESARQGKELCINKAITKLLMTLLLPTDDGRLIYIGLRYISTQAKHNRLRHPKIPLLISLQTVWHCAISLVSLIIIDGYCDINLSSWRRKKQLLDCEI